MNPAKSTYTAPTYTAPTYSETSSTDIGVSTRDIDFEKPSGNVFADEKTEELPVDIQDKLDELIAEVKEEVDKEYGKKYSITGEHINDRSYQIRQERKERLRAKEEPTDENSYFNQKNTYKQPKSFKLFGRNKKANVDEGPTAASPFLNDNHITSPNRSPFVSDEVRNEYVEDILDELNIQGSDTVSEFEKQLIKMKGEDASPRVIEEIKKIDEKIRLLEHDKTLKETIVEEEEARIQHLKEEAELLLHAEKERELKKLELLREQINRIESNPIFTEEGAVPDELLRMTKAELISLARKLRVPNFNKMNKSQLAVAVNTTQIIIEKEKKKQKSPRKKSGKQTNKRKTGSS
jgi:hypothetical protein